MAEVAERTDGVALGITEFRDNPLMDRRPLIGSKGFSIYYGDNAAVKEVSFDIPEGLVTAVIGPSGCGKSTFLRAINRMNDLIPGCHVEGELTLDGQDLYAPPGRRRLTSEDGRHGLPEAESLPEVDIRQYRLRAAASTGPATGDTLGEIVEKSLRQAALWDEVKDRLDDNALGLSGGQQQRLCMARALAVNPKVLLMDEPASALDPRSTSSIEDLIAELRGEYTIVIVTHNMQQAARVSDLTAFFYEGHLIEYGETKQIFTNPAEKQTEDYITGRFG